MRVASSTVVLAARPTDARYPGVSASLGTRPLPEKALTRVAAATTETSAPSAVETVASAREPR